ncbi:MAG: hypothetical protein JOZ31_20545 [Verrucomicrobia bacterium]|nr:hypothetical protein [Verrucomicrobiota bacterium]MBV8481235.1 hypothetical protein [Verrucomicrobiota bacterium]
MPIVGKIKDEISKAGQRSLGIDDVRFKLDAALGKLDLALQNLGRIEPLEGAVARINDQITGINQQITGINQQITGEAARINDQINNLKSFLTWYSNRVEPWFWTGNFSHADPEQELAGLLFNFLPGSVLLNVGPKTSDFAKAAAEVGYEVHHLEPTNDIAPLGDLKTFSDRFDFVNITRGNVDAGLVKALDSIQAAVLQIEFADDNILPAPDRVPQKTPVSTPEIVKELRKQGYYWNVMIFRTEVESFIRMGTNLASVPDQAWGAIVFFRDHQLFLKAFHWCKTTLPRYRAAPLA